MKDSSEIQASSSAYAHDFDRRSDLQIHSDIV